MRLYHGSNMAIDAIDLTKGRKGKDFGQGFYLSPDKKQADRMAEQTVMRNGTGVPVVTEFEFDESLASRLNFLIFKGYTRQWAEFVIMNRKNKTDIQAHDYDIVYGPIADDTVGLTIRLFQQKFIDIDEVVNRLKYVQPTFQYFFATHKAIQTLTRI